MMKKVMGLNEMGGGNDGEFLETKGFFCNERGGF